MIADKLAELVAQSANEVERLRQALKKANSQAEHFEREWYLRGDQIEALRLDAERYRWLRDCHPADSGLWVAMGVPHSPAGISCWRHEELDAAIDAEMKEIP